MLARIQLKRNIPQVRKSAIFFWNMAGSMCNALNAVLMVLVLTRICGAAVSGIYVLALSVGDLASPLACFQVRNFQASDTSHKYKFEHYYVLRICTMLAALVFGLGWIFFKGYDAYKGAVVVLCVLYRIIECYEDLYLGHLQLNHRLDIAGKTFALRIVVSFLAFLAVLLATKQMLTALIVYVVVELLWVLFVSIPFGNAFVGEAENLEAGDMLAFGAAGDVAPTRMHAAVAVTRALFLECWPFCVMQFLVNYIIALPKVAIDEYSDAVHQGYFGPLFLLVSVVNLFTIILYQLFITRLASEWNGDKRSLFVKHILMMTGAIAAIGIVCVIGGDLLGIPLLSLLYGLPELYDYPQALNMLLIGGIFNALSGGLSVEFTVLRRQKGLLVINLIAAGVGTVVIRMLTSLGAAQTAGTTGSAVPLVLAANEITGASMGYLITMAALAVLQGIYLIWVLTRANVQTRESRT